MILDGKSLAEIERNRVKTEVAAFGKPVKLAVILVGDDGASASYVASKEKGCRETGIQSLVIRMPADTEETALLDKIRELNADATVNGILVQMPVPDHIDESRVIDAIDPGKDVDCFHPYNFGKLFAGSAVAEPCTPKGIIRMLDHYQVDLYGKNAVVLGRSNIVGKPAAILLLQKNATVTVCHSKTRNLQAVCREADVLVAAIGKPRFVTADFVKDGAVVVDVGINRVPDTSLPKGYRVVGDVDYDAVAPKTAAITPVPGGVGLMTVAMLLDNTLKLARLQNETLE